jgi:hypothetical protein
MSEWAHKYKSYLALSTGFSSVSVTFHIVDQLAINYHYDIHLPIKTPRSNKSIKGSMKFT